ncbi:nitrilase and fragile histidine triad fusion protein NitFhit isoform X2 [Agrilus planipennis]|nr:nitrilase and fragile histidine triad fusion protein NitFhit isoform X2 [Agrilus planipennis]XP_018319893.1 nitrilase and fragile histidine triad fusion protein NitFhit isoform X2 [Agrilus planipennis]XP_018319894.1 nitrilase and fragile histidine triad fusion protein NitFhit isoform X2 [Agrilus planipennis]
MASSGDKCTIAVCQMTATNNKEENYDIIDKLVTEAAAKNAKMVFLPEACDYIGTNKNETKSLAEGIDGPVMTKYKSLAKRNDMWLSVGGFHLKGSAEEDKLYNAHIIIDNNGVIKAIYKKLHLFDVDIPEKNIQLKESNDVFSGDQILPPIDSPVGPLGLLICYDLRFPEVSILLRKKGTNVLTFPSAFTSGTGQAHWEVLLRARAIENQCYVIAAAQYGKHNSKRTSHGQAMIVDPWGQILAECIKYSENTPTNASIAIATLDNTKLNKIRQDIPVFQNRRDDMYQLVDTSKQEVPSIDAIPFYMFNSHKIPSSTVFYRSKHCFAFTNIRCVVAGHVLVASLRSAKRLPDLAPEEICDLFLTVVKVQKVLEIVYKASSSTICVQDGPAAGQTIPQVHCHVMPRSNGDFNQNDEVYERLAAHDKPGYEQPIRKLEEQIAEATLLRKYF